MKKTVVNVPKGIRYISDWKEFERIFPRFPHILDKQITGCGMTEWFISNSMNVVLCSPRNILLDNKEEQHQGEVYRVRSDYFDKELGVDKDTNKKLTPEEIIEAEKELEVDQTEYKKETLSTFERINEEFDTYSISRNIRPKKILVTYDSFHIVKDVLKSRGILGSYVVVIDEFQSIFTDSRFKSDTELEFVGQLQDIEQVCYLSATPMMDNYLKDIPEFANLPYYELDWGAEDYNRIKQPDLTVNVIRSIYEQANKIIRSYKDNRFRSIYLPITGSDRVRKVESREAVFYVNSVTNIIQIIKNNSLSPEEVNILCAKTSKNEKAIQSKLGAKWSIGRVPLENEPRKMFTFCTRTVYLGADFYSDNARSFILSDANVECLAVDISLDLPQILGRQRLESNPWKNSAEFYYKPLNESKEMSQQLFDEIVKEKLNRSAKRLENYEAAPNKDVALEDIVHGITFLNYKNDYVGVNTRGGSHAKPEVNKLVMIAERRAFDIQQVDYRDRFSVINLSHVSGDTVGGEVTAVLVHYQDLKTVFEKLKYLCEVEISDEAWEGVISQLDDRMRKYLALGKDRLFALGYNLGRINKELGIKSYSLDDLSNRIYQEFYEGEIISSSEIKEKLAIIYEDGGFKKAPKATDLQYWFDAESIQYRVGADRYRGLKLNKKLR